VLVLPVRRHVLRLLVVLLVVLRVLLLVLARSAYGLLAPGGLAPRLPPPVMVSIPRTARPLTVLAVVTVLVAVLPALAVLAAPAALAAPTVRLLAVLAPGRGGVFPSGRGALARRRGRLPPLEGGAWPRVEAAHAARVREAHLGCVGGVRGVGCGVWGGACGLWG